ncbi:hypothetical protein H5410_003552 [Solanum commersonii]|uniref:Uncharacterized protein n=1 Tax=Solanum commersonii TaxID=4109 RepID=A0A9J6B5E6_SOLCO|nr:hypothetical protein H5410_003552 [Solanum commersonii]
MRLHSIGYEDLSLFIAILYHPLASSCFGSLGDIVLPRRTSRRCADCSLFFADLILSSMAQDTGTKGEVRPCGDPQAFSFFVLFSLFVSFCKVVSMFSFKLQIPETYISAAQKDVLNSATQDSIMNAHNKIRFTYAIKCVLKDSSCDSPISKNLMLTILASNAS